MSEIITWDRTKNLAYIVGLIMFEHIEVLRHQYEGYVIYIERFPNSETWNIVIDDESLAIRFSSTDTFSMRITLLDKALQELKSRIKKKNAKPIIQKHLFTLLVKDAVKYRQRIRLRWDYFTVSVNPSGDDLTWFIRYKNDTVNFVTAPTNHEVDRVFEQFNELTGENDER